MWSILDEHAKTSHVTYILHHTSPNGQYPKENKNEKDFYFIRLFFLYHLNVLTLYFSYTFIYNSML